MNDLLIVFLILVVLPLFWIGVTYLLALVSGWRMLAKHYQTDFRPEGYSKGMVSGNLGWVGYNHVLTVVITKEGLYLSVFVLFSLANPPVFIPWERIELIGKHRLFWFIRQKLIIYSPTGRQIVELSLPREIFEETADIIPHDIDGSK